MSVLEQLRASLAGKYPADIIKHCTTGHGSIYGHCPACYQGQPRKEQPLALLVGGLQCPSCHTQYLLQADDA